MAAVRTVHAEQCPEYMDVASEIYPEPEPTFKTTIFDLNEDCWRCILDYIHEAQIVATERVSRRWQSVVHRYLRDAGVCFLPYSALFQHHDCKIFAKNRVFTIDFRSIYNHSEMEDVLGFLDKWGPCIVHTMCHSPEVFKKVTETCPKLRSLAITMNSFRSGPLSQDQAKFLEMLERIVFIDYTYNNHANMRYERELIKREFRTEIYHRSKLSPDTSSRKDFWPNFRPTNIKSFTFRGMFDFEYFLHNVDCFPQLIDLNIQGDFHNIRLLLEKTPKLERLCMMRCNMSQIEPEDIGSPCGLQNLKTLVLWNSEEKSWWLEGVLNGCLELEILEMTPFDYGPTRDLPITVQALCKAVGRSLTALRVPCRNLQDSDVATLIERCPKLAALDLRLCHTLSRNLVDVAAQAARGRQTPLWLLIGGTDASVYFYRNEVPELIVDTEFDRQLFRGELRPRQYIPGPRPEHCY